MTHAVTKMGFKAALIASMLFSANSALADDVLVSDNDATAVTENAADEFLAADTVSLTELDQNRGTNNDITLNQTSQVESNANSSNNSNVGNTGGASISGFNNSSGVINVINNTGNNVAINNISSVNIVLQPM